MHSQDKLFQASFDPQVSLSSIPITNLRTMTPEAEKFNGWMAMLGVVAALGAYATTGQIIPGIF